MNEIEQRRARWAKDKPRWQYVLDTFWQLDYEHLMMKLSDCRTLDEAVEMADRERDGMIAT